ncbi:mitochondrial 18 KDa protein-domain-containing protein [Aspergillus ambiguus]|uniref:mitochondrial fission process 1 family protein n=1 Tax=Aspergillus ambiguus TaxID=176160 RepID=UPI003CCD5DEC
MFWGSHHESPDVAQQPIARENLPPQLQRLVDRDDSFYDDIYSPYSVDSTETPYRYAGYANRLRTVLLSAHRYVAYTSDIGESFRPVAHPYLVRSAYAISWTYLIGDVVHEGYKAYLRNRRVLAPPCDAYKDAKDLSQDQVALGMVTGSFSPNAGAKPSDSLTPWPTTRIPLAEDYRVVMAERAVFQSLASMGLPALTIHSVVKYTGRMLKNSKHVLLRTWAPIGLGLSVVPFLPYVFDEPVEEAVDWAFRTGLRAYAGEDAVRPLPQTAHAVAEDSTSLGHLLQVQRDEGHPGEAAATSATLSWEEYKEERRRAKEERMREREKDGRGGVLAMLGLEKKKNE